jgi:hypothetical protein
MAGLELALQPRFIPFISSKCDFIVEIVGKTRFLRRLRLPEFVELL